MPHYLIMQYIFKLYSIVGLIIYEDMFYAFNSK